MQNGLPKIPQNSSSFSAKKHTDSQLRGIPMFVGDVASEAIKVGAHKSRGPVEDCHGSGAIGILQASL